ncbi:hypothetical protein GMOD_00003229 [Pyrenophora seminiperda CCB06]|uniref:Uncharacterized protein n=1 Tax=Pyrenophora seminiperda CCB06 TaxID=1302712 RepID=A0A3M7MIG4_9PLEO|nr:hypothetical protein GMOD_00003229 [Pyrenophora seminiperda CCB06]
MPRRPPNMRITVVDSPTLPTAFRRHSLPIFTNINEPTSPIKQTFLLSPSPTSTVFCTDSPVLGSSLVTPTTTYTCTSPSTIPASIAGAYPTPRFYSPSIAAQSYRSSSRYSNWSTDPTLVEGMLTPRLATISDILPDDTDLYVDERPQTIRWSVLVSEAQQQQQQESAEMGLGPEMSSPNYYPTSPTVRSLPDEEYRALRRSQQKAELNAYFAQPSLLPRSSIPRTAYQEAELSQSRRSQISDVKDATRRALGSNFDFTDVGYERSSSSQRSSSATSPSRYSAATSSSYEEKIPQRYIDEFNEKWFEDDLKYGAKQYAADRDGSASWRTHEAMYGDIRPLPRRDTTLRYTAQSDLDSRVDNAIEEPRPQLTSRWSVSTIDSVDEPKKRSLLGRRSRS